MAAEEPGALKQAFASVDPYQAWVARDMLAEAGIEAFIFDGETSRMLGTACAVPARLMVHADRLDEARDLLRELGFIT